MGGMALSLFKILKTQDWGNFLRVDLVTISEIFLYEFPYYSDEWARNRFKVLGYDKRKLPPNFNEV